MSVWITSARQPGPFALGSAAFALTMLLTSAPAFSQARAPAFAQAPAQPKALPKAAPQPKAPPQAAPAPAQPQAAAPQVPQLIYSPWTKICVKGQEANAQQVCFTGKEGRLPDNGMMVIGAVLAEQDGSPNKMLRITVPLGVMVQPGMRVIVDQGQPMTGQFLVCDPSGCVAQFEASAELIGKFKKGQSMVVQAVSGQTGGAISLPLPLPDFAKAYDGPPTDPKVVEERNKKLQEEFAKKQQQQQPPQ